MTRPTDAHKEYKSYTVFRQSDGSFIIKPSHFLPGYTKAHHATPLEAAQWAFDNVVEKQRELSKDLKHILDLVRENSPEEKIADESWAAWNLERRLSTTP